MEKQETRDTQETDPIQPEKKEDQERKKIEEPAEECNEPNNDEKLKEVTKISPEEILEASERKDAAEPLPFIGPTRPRIEELTRIAQLGSGNFSRIYLVEEYRTKNLFAMKEYSKWDAQRKKKTQDLVMEKYVLNKLAGLKRVVKLHETFKDEANVYFNMEYLEGGELWDMIHCFGFPSRSEVKYYFYKIVKAVEEIHSRGIIHRDLKPENIMLNKEKTDLKLVDFATSWDFQNPEMKGSGNGSTGRRVYYHFVGTPQYMPIESIRNKGSYPQTDIYAMGCILYQLICGFVPYIGPGEYAIFKKTDEGHIEFYPFFTEDEKSLILGMTAKEYQDRLTLDQIKDHPYFRDDLQFYRTTAKSVEEIQGRRSKQDQWFVNIREKVVKKFKEFDVEAEKEKKEQEMRPIEEKVEKAEENTENEGKEEEEKLVNGPEVPEVDPKRTEKAAFLKEAIGEALKELPISESCSEELLKSRLKHLRKQLEHKGKLKQFEHYF